MMTRDTLRCAVGCLALLTAFMPSLTQANGVKVNRIAAPTDTQPTVLAQNVNGETPANGRYQNLIEEGAPPLEFYAQPSSVLAPLPTVPSERPSQPLLVLPSVAPSVEDLDNLQSMQLMQESRRNSDLAARLQGEPRKMLLERNEAISAQLLRSTQAKEVAHRKASLQLEVVEIRPAEIIAQQTKTVDWSSVSAFEKKLGQWFFDKHYPVEVTAPLRRFFQEVKIKDRTGRSDRKRTRLKSSH